MNTILVSLNSKFIHSNLAIRYLSNYVADVDKIDIYEFTINQSLDYIASEIYKLSPDVVGFSTYIWNFKETLKICEILKTVKPEIKILLGGPEVSYDGEDILKDIPYIDYIIYGEGEETFMEFLKALKCSKDLSEIKGLIYREGSTIIRNCERELIKNLNTIPSPYDNFGNEYENKIVYYEASRGCPFNCQYCLSSTLRGVRVFDMDRVKKDLTTLIEGKAKQVKFVDRTFNANKDYALEIMKFIKDKKPDNINFHFEITAHLIDEEFLDFLKDIREGLFQFEIGVQSTNEDTVDAISRTTDFDILSEVTKTIKSYKNIHQHLDLIAGLPYEGYESFMNSFNDVYNLKPEKLQLGFLKLLKGSGLRLAKDKYGYKYIDEPPYEVLESKYISYGDLLRLKGIEDLVEKYYNEGYFEHSLNYIIKKHYRSPFDFYEDLFEFWDLKEYHKVSHSRNGLYDILVEFINYKKFVDSLYITQILKFDFTLSNKNLKLKLGYEENDKYRLKLNLHELLRNEEILSEYLYDYKELPTKKLINRIIVERFEIDILGIIEDDYNIEDNIRESFVLFQYKDGTITRGIAFDITEIVKEMI